MSTPIDAIVPVTPGEFELVGFGHSWLVYMFMIAFLPQLFRTYVS